jgi:UDP-N-acetylmuramate dehydrogenase
MMAARNSADIIATALRDEPMSRHTSWRVGGPADLFFRPGSVAELQAILNALPDDMPVLWIGYGSNLLVRDGGIRGAVISTGNLQREIEFLQGRRVRAGAGVSCARLARQCARRHLGPATFFAGIPGTLGGALAMNAGAFGGETWEQVESVETIDRAGTVRVRLRDEFEIAYRSVAGTAGEWFVAATFKFETDEHVDADAIKQLLTRRGASQPLGKPSCGSVFRNPPGMHAGQLIEAAGLKGLRIGGAEVSTKHANFIVNEDNATAADIESLIDFVVNKVRESNGVELHPEVRIVGEYLKDLANART